MKNWTPGELIAFEKDIADCFLARDIRAPIHLAGGNEDALIEIFKDVKPCDWIVSTYRSHYHALLKGISPEWLKSEILEGRSMHIMNAEHRFISTSIVGGGVPIAVGLAMGIKRKESIERVWCFIGDMASRTGGFMEGSEYARNWKLPVTFVIENNGLSVNTPTDEVWGLPVTHRNSAICYGYDRTWPHSGCGAFVRF